MAKYDWFMDLEGDNDLILNEKGDFSWVKTIEESLAQRLDLRFKTWVGEWGYNTQFGTPYRRIMNSGFTKEQLDAEFARIALLEEDVTSVKNIISSLDRINRKYVIERIEVYTNGGAINIPLSNPYTKTNSYPKPYDFNDFLLCQKTPEEIKYINELYNFVNFEGLPESGNSTWWNLWK